MSVQRILTATLVMAGVTYLIRMLPLTLFRKKVSNRFLRSFLAYVPYTVLAAMTFPGILYSASSVCAAGIGLITACVLAYRGRGLLTVALGASAAVFAAEQLLHVFCL